MSNDINNALAPWRFAHWSREYSEGSWGIRFSVFHDDTTEPPCGPLVQYTSGRIDPVSKDFY
jgi:hypothetical protein